MKRYEIHEGDTGISHLITKCANTPMYYAIDNWVSYPLSSSQLIYRWQLTQTVCTFKLLVWAKHHEKMFEQFSNKRRKEFLLSLRENLLVNVKFWNIATVAVGNIIIMMNDKTQRSFWKLAGVEELLPGQYGVVWAARVKVVNTKGKPVVLQWSVLYLISLEVSWWQKTDNINQTLWEKEKEKKKIKTTWEEIA